MIKLSEHFNINCIELNFHAGSKGEALEKFVHVFERSDEVKDSKGLLNDLHKRESQDTTAVGKGIAIPHCHTSHVGRIILGYAFSDKGVNFDSPDGIPIKHFFLVAVPITKKKEMLKILVKISHTVRKPGVLNKLRNSRDVSDVIEIIKKNE